MKNTVFVITFLILILLLGSCTESLDPLSPGSVDGEYALGIKSLMPLTIGNSWTYNVTLYDASGVKRTSYSYTLSVRDTVVADTGKIPLVPPQKDRKSLSRGALLWYLLEGEAGAKTCWQSDSLEILRIRKADDARFYEQSAFDFRAFVGDVTPARYVGRDTLVWASGDQIITNADSVRSMLASKGADTLRTTLGSAPYFQYRQYYVTRSDYVDYYFKPGFGLFLVERYQLTTGGAPVCVRRDQLSSYYFK